LFFFLLVSFNNILNPLFRRVGCFCLSLERQRDKNSDPRTWEKTQRSEGWQAASVGALSAKMLLVFVLARKRRLDLGTVRAVAERRPPGAKGSGKKKRRLPNVFWTFTENAKMVWYSEEIGR
jgi:hypothetical protein